MNNKVILTSKEIGMLRDLLENYYKIPNPNKLEKAYIEIDKKLLNAEEI